MRESIRGSRSTRCRKSRDRQIRRAIALTRSLDARFTLENGNEIKLRSRASSGATSLLTSVREETEESTAGFLRARDLSINIHDDDDDDYGERQRKESSTMPAERLDIAGNCHFSEKRNFARNSLPREARENIRLTPRLTILRDVLARNPTPTK